MGRRWVAECPAKINLFLRIEPPDRSGYHPLETRFQTISLFDTLEATEDGDGLDVVGAEVPDDNTVAKAWRLMREVAELPPLGLKLTKRIPSEAGLGGGSSDAAGLLRILRKLLPASIPDRDFLAVARSVGADVPFFLVGGLAAASGHGEVLTPLPDPPPRPLVVVMPPARCSTPTMYRALDAAREAGSQATFEAPFVQNDFHAVAPSACIDAARALIAAGLSPVGLAGSGAAVFGFAISDAQARAVAAASATAWVAHTVGRAESTAVFEAP